MANNETRHQFHPFYKNQLRMGLKTYRSKSKLGEDDVGVCLRCLQGMEGLLKPILKEKIQKFGGIKGLSFIQTL